MFRPQTQFFKQNFVSDSQKQGFCKTTHFGDHAMDKFQHLSVLSKQKSIFFSIMNSQNFMPS